MHIWIIYYRNWDGRVMKHVTNSKELHLEELEDMKQRGVKVLSHYRMYA